MTLEDEDEDDVSEDGDNIGDELKPFPTKEAPVNAKPEYPPLAIILLVAEESTADPLELLETDTTPLTITDPDLIVENDIRLGLVL